MKINKFKKYGTNKYKVYIDDKVFVIYEDVILKYNLLYKKDIDDDLLNEVMLANYRSSIYDVVVKYINVKMRFESEIFTYLKNKNYDLDDINSTIIDLKYNNLINDEIVTKSFINDKLILTNYGPLKIKNELIKYNVDSNVINKYISTIDNDLIIDRLNKIIDKEIRINEKLPKNKIINKIYTKCITLGYDKKDIDNVLSSKYINTKSDIESDYNKLYTKYKDKYDKYKLNTVLKNKLYQKGYNLDDINRVVK